MLPGNLRETIEAWTQRSHTIAIKKLARNDCSWADSRDSHQNGFFVPRALTGGALFPRLQARVDKPHIQETKFQSLWISTGEVKQSRLVHYTNKGSEVHLTGVPKEEFAGLSPASLVLGGVLHEPESGVSNWFVVVDSQSEDAAWLETLYDLDTEFHAALFPVADLATEAGHALAALQRELEAALETNTLDAFIAKASMMPDPLALANKAQDAWKQRNKMSTLDPYALAVPGDAIMRISRDIEYDIFKRHEMRHRAAQVLQLLNRSGPGGLAGAVVVGFAELNAIFLSASQVRRSRAGRSFEHHIARMLSDGGILHHAQAVRGAQRPDFVLPSLERVLAATGIQDEAMILSAKTTLRERWKQVSLEQVNCAFFLATVDDRVSSDAIDAMSAEDIVLVVPEELKSARETVYKNKTNVITFRDFFQHEVRMMRPTLIRNR